jgi:nucleoside-diphosphate-sugar epimerase
MLKKRVLVTGANGWIGSALVTRLINDGCDVLGAVRHETLANHLNCTIGEVDGSTDWTAALHNIDYVVHLAARVHVMNEYSNNPLSEFRRTNVEGTINLAKQAAAAGVTRFLFMSSIKVNGEITLPGKPFSAYDVPAPTDPYGESKAEAELKLLQLAQRVNMDVAIIRPPLVYGPNAKGNFANLLDWVRRGIPLPLGLLTHNRRSLISIDNLLDLTILCLSHPSARNKIFLASDDEDISTVELLQKVAVATGQPIALYKIPVFILSLIAKASGKSNQLRRLSESLQVDISETKTSLGWHPQQSVMQGLIKAVATAS